MSKTAHARSNTRSQMEADRRRKVLQIAAEVSSTLGTDFFLGISRHLASAVDADCAYVAELVGPFASRITTLAVFRKAGQSDSFDQDLGGTASGQVLTDGAFACSRDATKLFPVDTFLSEMRAEAYVGLRLTDSRGQALGLLALVFGRRLSELALVKSVLEAFSARAAAELERKRANDVLRESEERYRAFISSNPDAMWRIEFEQPVPTHLDEDEQLERIFRFGYVAECNDAMCRLAGVSSEKELVGARFSDLFPRTDTRVVEELRAAIRSKFRMTTVETSPIDETGRRLYRLRSQFGIVENSELRRIWGTTRDLTDLRRAEMSLAASERRFREVLDNIQMPAVMLDQTGVITFCNDCLLRLVERPREELTGSNWLERIIPAGERDPWRALLLSKSLDTQHLSSHFEGTILTRNAAPRLIAWNTTILRNEEGQFAGVAAIGSDITDQRALEAQLQQAEKLESIGRLASGIAHDFSNLLTVVQGYTAKLLQEVRTADPHYDSLAAIETAAAKCADLTQQLLTIGHRTPYYPERVDINNIIAAEEEIIRSLIGEGIQWAIMPGPSLKFVYADPRQIRRVVTNLVTNARDAMPQGGSLTIETSNIQIGQGITDYPANIAPGDYVRLAVADTGTGLTEDIKTHMFEPFFTTKEPGKGTGLGLPTVYGIVKQNGGHIIVHSKSGKGATFEVLLPALVPEKPASLYRSRRRSNIS